MPSRSKPQIHSLTAPELPDRLVTRPHIVNTIKRFLGSGTEIVLVEGTRGSGRTTLLREFIETVDEPCFALFLRAGNRASYSPSLVNQELGSQLHFYLRDEIPPTETEWSDAKLRSLWQKCNNKLTRHRSLGYVVIDGIHHIDSRESTISEAIWELLPRHFAQIKILCSVDQGANVVPSSYGVQPKPYPVQCFSSHESHEYLIDVIPDEDKRNEFHKQYGGHPACLASLRRQVRFLSETSTDLTLCFPTDMEGLLKNEWEISMPSSSEIIKALAALIAAGLPLGNSSLSKYCNLPEKEIEIAFRALPFLEYLVNNSTWRFCCNGIREVVRRFIKADVERACELISSTYLNDPNSREALNQLPQYLESTAQSEHLLEWLTEERIAEKLRNDKSVASLEPTLRKAISVCKSAQQYDGLLAYSLISSTIKYLTYPEDLNDEIGARATLGDFDGAMKLVNNVPLQTRRIRLMAVVLDAFSDEEGVKLDPLRLEFETSLSEIDWSSLPTDDAISIAEDVYPVDPARGLDILNKVIGADGGEGALDLALARLSLSAIKSKASDQLSRTSDEHDPIPHYGLIDNKLRQFLDAVGRVLEAKSASEMLSAIKTIQEPSQKLFVLRKWSLQNALEKDAILITEHAINLSIESTSSVPTADFFREVTTPLPYHEECEMLEEIIKMLDGQDHIIKKRGPTVEYVRLQLQIVQSEWNRGHVKRAVNRMDELYCGTIEMLEESSIQLSCLSWYTSIAGTLRGRQQIDDCEVWVELVEEHYERCLGTLLQNSAEQLEIVRGALQALAVNFPEKACIVASRLNTERRRTMAYWVIIDAICRSVITRPKFDTVSKILENLLATEHYDSAILQLVSRLCSEVADKKQNMVEVTWIIDFIGECDSAIIRIKCMASLLAVATNKEGCKRTMEQLETEIVSTFDGLISETDKYRAACILLDKLKGKANECEQSVSHVLTFLRKLEGNRPLDSVTYTGLYYVLDLLAKSVRGLAESGDLSENDVERVNTLINTINDDGLKLTLNASLALYLWSVGRNEMYANIVNNYLWPVLNGLASSDLSTTFIMWEEVYPVLWLQNRDRAREGIEEFPDWFRERCNASLCYTILRRQPIADPFDDRARNKRIGRSYDDVINLLQVCRESNNDVLIYSIFAWIADELTGKNPKQKLTDSQKAEVARMMYQMADTKLPIATGIMHNGYRIMCQAQALRVSNIDGCSWEKLTGEAKKLDNIADRTFVLAHLGLDYENRKKGRALLNAAGIESEKLLTHEDRLDRYFTIASIVADKEKNLAKKIVKKAFEEVAGIGHGETGIEDRELIDLAYRIDPGLPMELAVVYDKDNVRREYYEKRAEREVKSLNMKRKIVNNEIPQRSRDNKQNEKEFASAVWRALQSLNSGMSPKVEPERCREIILRASESSLHIAYPLYSWALASLAMSYSGEGARRRYLRDAFEGVLRGAKFYCNLTKVTGSLLDPPDWEDVSMKEGTITVDIGERQKALNFLEKWIRSKAEEFLIIADPYFGVRHLEILRNVLKADHEITVSVVMGCPGKNDSIDEIVEDLNAGWKKICEQAPPKTEITVVYRAGDSMKRAPFHDRWLLSKGVGLNLGTGYDSLGNRDSFIRQLSDRELRATIDRIEPYRKRDKKMVEGKTLVYSKFELAR